MTTMRTTTRITMIGMVAFLHLSSSSLFSVTTEVVEGSVKMKEAATVWRVLLLVLISRLERTCPLLAPMRLKAFFWAVEMTSTF